MRAPPSARCFSRLWRLLLTGGWLCRHDVNHRQQVHRVAEGEPTRRQRPAVCDDGREQGPAGVHGRGRAAEPAQRDALAGDPQEILIHSPRAGHSPLISRAVSAAIGSYARVGLTTNTGIRLNTTIRVSTFRRQVIAMGYESTRFT